MRACASWSGNFVFEWSNLVFAQDSGVWQTVTAEPGRIGKAELRKFGIYIEIFVRGSDAGRGYRVVAGAS